MSAKLSFYMAVMRATIRPAFSRMADAMRLQTIMEKFDRRMSSWPEDKATIRVENVDGMKAHWIEPLNGYGDRVILYLHGGAFIARSPRTHGTMLATLCRETGARGFMPDYGLLPQNPMPAAQDDCEKAYRFLLDQGVDASQIVLAGDSAGGFLCMTTLHRIRAADLPMPRSVILLSPGGVIREEERGTMITNAKRDAMFTIQAIETLTELVAPPYAEGPDYCPLEFDLSGLPPIHIEVGGTEILLDDSRILHERVQAAGGDSKLVITPNAPHVLPVFPVPEAREAIDRMAAFIWKSFNLAHAKS